MAIENTRIIKAEGVHATRVATGVRYAHFEAEPRLGCILDFGGKCVQRESDCYRIHRHFV